MHAGRQDVAILRRSWNTEVTNVFDTQVAAGFLGFGNQEGYESLVRKVLRVKLKGNEGFTKWDRRPLTPQQLEYAGDDARLLLTLGDELERRLDGAWPARVGAGGVARPRGRERRARRRSLLREAASSQPAERLGARGRARARRVARGGGAHRRTARPEPCCPTRRSWSSPAGRRATGTGSSRSAACLHRCCTAAATSCLAAIARGRDAARARGAAGAVPARPGRRAAGVAGAGARAPPLDGVGRGRGADRHPVGARARWCIPLRRGDNGDHVRVSHGWRRELVGEELGELVKGRRALSVDPDGGLVVRDA